MTKTFIITVDQFHFGPRANALGLSASIKPDGRGNLVLRVTGNHVAIDKLTTEMETSGK